MKTARSLFCALVLGLPAIALAGPTETKTPAPAADALKLNDVDVQALSHQHAVNLLEVDMGKLAQRNGSAAVKTYGMTLVKDHMAGDKDVTAFAKKHGVATIPADTAFTDSDKKMMADMTAKLKTLKGADFDHEFLNMMADAHDKEITKITTDIGLVTNADLTTLLKNIKPVLERHADTAKTLQKATNKS